MLRDNWTAPQLPFSLLDMSLLLWLFLFCPLYSTITEQSPVYDDRLSLLGSFNTHTDGTVIPQSVLSINYQSGASQRASMYSQLTYPEVITCLDDRFSLRFVPTTRSVMTIWVYKQSWNLKTVGRWALVRLQQRHSTTGPLETVIMHQWEMQTVHWYRHR